MYASIVPLAGLPTPVAPGTVIDYQVPDLYARPWARIWEEFHEQDMRRLERPDLVRFDQPP